MLITDQLMAVIENHRDAYMRQTIRHISLTGWNWFDRLIYLMLAAAYGTTVCVIVYLLGG